MNKIKDKLLPKKERIQKIHCNVLDNTIDDLYYNNNIVWHQGWYKRIINDMLKVQNRKKNNSEFRIGNKILVGVRKSITSFDLVCKFRKEDCIFYLVVCNSRKEKQN